MGTIHKTDSSVKEMHAEMGALHKTMSRVVLDFRPAAMAGILPLPLKATTTSSIGKPITDAFGHTASSTIIGGLGL